MAVDFIIKVKTASDLTAGTDLDVFLRLKGQHAATVNIPLNAQRSLLPGESGKQNFLSSMRGLKLTSIIAGNSFFDSGAP